MIGTFGRVLAVTVAAFLVVVLPTVPATAASPYAVDAKEMAMICEFLAGDVHSAGEESDYGCTIAEGQFRCAAATRSCVYWPQPPVSAPLAVPCGRVSGVHAVLANVATCSGDKGVVVAHCPPDSRNPDGPPGSCDVGTTPNNPPKKPDEPSTRP
jgi:hypothetical protein